MTLLRLTPAMATHRGMRRRNNEDSVGYEYPSDLNTLQSYGALFVVADGVGGLAAGDQASQMAVEKLIQHYYGGDPDISAELRLAKAFHKTNADVFHSLNREAATTLVAVLIIADQLIAASVGDSIIYRIRDGNIEQLNEEDVLHSDDKQDGALTKAIGYRENLEVETISGVAQEGDKFLLCSDGITRYLKPDQLSRLSDFRDPRDSVRRMINQANAAGGADNVTALLVLIGESISDEQFAQHQQKISVRVAVDTDPMIKLDVATKPHTQIPLARPERISPDTVLDELEKAETDKIPPIPPQTPQPVEQQSVSAGENNNMLILLGVAVIVIGAIIVGGGLALLGNSDSDPTEIPTTNTESVATDEPIENVTEPIEISGEPLVGDTITLSSAVVTFASLDDQEVAAFVASPGTNYSIDDIFEDSEGQLWYRLLEQESNQVGWVLASDLPDYQLQRD